MIEKFLKAKHWQLFLLTFGIPMIFQFVMMGTMFASIGSGNVPDLSLMFNYMMFLPIIMILFIGVFFGWFWSVVIGLQEIIPDEAKMKLTSFKILFFIPVVYMLLISIFIGVSINGFVDSSNKPSPSLIGGLIALIIPLHLFSMFCIFHTLFYVAKTFKTAELKRKVSFSDFAGEFFLIWFYPIGIWIVQPKINKMIED